MRRRGTSELALSRDYVTGHVVDDATFVSQIFKRSFASRWFSAELHDDPSSIALDVRSPDVGDNIEAFHEVIDNRSSHKSFRKRNEIASV